MSVETRSSGPRAKRLDHLLRRSAADLLAPPAILGATAVPVALLGATLPSWALAGALAGYALSGSV